MERNLNHEVINKVDLNNLLRFFKPSQLAFIFGVTEDYIYKTERLQRTQTDDTPLDEMKLGRRGSWKLSKERIEYLKVMEDGK